MTIGIRFKKQKQNKEIFRSSLTHIQITLCLYFLINEYRVKYISNNYFNCKLAKVFY